MQLKLIIEFQTAVHHGSGYGLSGVVDRGALRDGEGMPYLAGSAIKGKFRHTAIRVVRANGDRVCGTPEYPALCRAGKACAVCAAFGSSRLPGAAVFGDAYPCEPERGILRLQIAGNRSAVLSGGSDVRSSTAIDRRSGTVLPEHLFSTETIPSLVRFESDIDVPEGSVKLFHECVKLIGRFGGDASRGLGWCTFQLLGGGHP
jgi:CRISPR/Cas system CSM-associated protein Csm3 (group 7 of RAMP superfamily)